MCHCMHKLWMQSWIQSLKKFHGQGHIAQNKAKLEGKWNFVGMMVIVKEVIMKMVLMINTKEIMRGTSLE